MPGYPRPRNLPPTPLSEVAALLGVVISTDPLGGAGEIHDVHDVSVTGITHASAEVRPGDCYAGLPGARHHGANFAGAARAAGAVALLTDPRGAELASQSGLPTIVVHDPRAALGQAADLIYRAPTGRLPVIGITGTAGKTSVSYLIAAGLRAAGQVPGIIGTVETRMGDLVVASARTTPEATDLHALFAVALELGVDVAVMEVSSHALALGRVGGVRFAVGAFTNLGIDHLDFHADLDDYFAAKARLFDGRCAVEIINLDDPAGARLNRPNALTYSVTRATSADWYATDIVRDGYGQRFFASGPGSLRVATGVGLPGRHNVSNALLALAALTAVGVDPHLAGAGIAAGAVAPGRMERVEGGAGVIGIVDYAHKPGAVAEVLAALRGLDPKKIICVIGAGGDRDAGKRPIMGAEAAGGSEVVIITDDNPRSEDPASIRRAVLAGARRAAGAGTQVIEIAGRGNAIAEAAALAGPGDVIALLGKGHECGQEIAGTVHPFDDRTELAKAMAAAAARGGNA
ncbi:MAG: UDP-N-acetylmuramoyl-L-alanyl-D-glutamate--2,6-diaminopimelate ligase [Micromonosporaceae bacterium]|nr:UDP-N-acetylmuramoyl-L-alanyl-D-glutamate--2,6-diaminopimelate ligase [Micromonosporaceae bacterium]